MQFKISGGVFKGSDLHVNDINDSGWIPWKHQPFDKWLQTHQRKDFSNLHGVYIVTRRLGDEETDFIKMNNNSRELILYVGETGESKGFAGRLGKHAYRYLFHLKATAIRLYAVSNNTAKDEVNRLLLEKAKIIQLDPILNKTLIHPRSKKNQSLVDELYHDIYNNESIKKILDEIEGEDEKKVKETLNKIRNGEI
ncbi:hypothetical protein [Bacillus cereus]|uniref:hypothetical protein n=1 Tax=Bacillus cereus TaxID=1396 RepID=UPI000B5E52D0|nr:hypothetical protein [Bacillus cereus]ASL64005.1 hypothetical protein FORC47_1160 [Bacillus cereus]